MDKCLYLSWRLSFAGRSEKNAACSEMCIRDSYMRITVNAYYLSRTACCQQQADGPCTGAKFQNTGLPDQMRESCQKNSIRRKTKFFRVLPDRIITAGQGIAAFCSFTHFRSDRPWNCLLYTSTLKHCKLVCARIARETRENFSLFRQYLCDFKALQTYLRENRTRIFLHP